MTKYKHPLDWSPAPFTIFRNNKLQEEIQENGYAIVDLLTEENISELLTIYSGTHQINDKKGGMFYSVYSKDVTYRKRVHEEIKSVLSNCFESHFENYNNALNFFINKVSGTNSNFSIHQDSSAIDEFKHSALSVWIPLQDVDESNGALWLIEKTHQMFSPYRSVSFPPPFADIKETLADYFQPISLKKGQALFFDSRVIHTSGKNTSGKDRIAVVSGILPKSTTFQLSYQDSLDAPIELYEQEDDFLINYPNFFHDCVLRPTIGKKIGEIPFAFPTISKEKFEEDCVLFSIPKRNLYKESKDEINFLTDPISPKKNFLKKLFSQYGKTFTHI
jgi:hypothetical protein